MLRQSETRTIKRISTDSTWSNAEQLVYVSNRHGNRSSVDSMFEHLEWRPLEQRRRDARLTMLFLDRQRPSSRRQDR